MRGVHPIYASKWEAFMRPWYAKNVVASPYTPKPVVFPRPLRRHPVYASKWRAQARPVYADRPPAQPHELVPIDLFLGPGIQPTNPEIIEREQAYMRPWQHYIPYRGWPRTTLELGVNV